MTEHDGIKKIFSGTQTEAGYVKELLKESDIGVMIKNTLREGMIADWESGTPFIVYVTEHDYEKAHKIVEQYKAAGNVGDTD